MEVEEEDLPDTEAEAEVPPEVEEEDPPDTEAEADTEEVEDQEVEDLEVEDTEDDISFKIIFNVTVELFVRF